MLVSLAGLKLAENHWSLVSGIAVLTAILFYLILGIREYLFVKRSRLYFGVFLITLYLLFLEFFAADKSSGFLWQHIFTALAVFLIFWEWLAIISSFHFPKREMIAAGASTLILAEILWGIALLPIGFLSSANLALLTAFLMADLLFKHFSGELSSKTAFFRLVIFILLAAFILGTSNWSPLA